MAAVKTIRTIKIVPDPERRGHGGLVIVDDETGEVRESLRLTPDTVRRFAEVLNKIATDGYAEDYEIIEEDKQRGRLSKLGLSITFR